nr:hypothetical protein CFP56_70408 [Quercus suber]
MHAPSARRVASEAWHKQHVFCFDLTTAFDVELLHLYQSCSTQNGRVLAAINSNSQSLIIIISVGEDMQLPTTQSAYLITGPPIEKQADDQYLPTAVYHGPRGCLRGCPVKREENHVSNVVLPFLSRPQAARCQSRHTPAATTMRSTASRSE